MDLLKTLISSASTQVKLEILFLLFKDVDMCVFNYDTRQLDSVDSVCMNGNSIQFNVNQLQR